MQSTKTAGTTATKFPPEAARQPRGIDATGRLILDMWSTTAVMGCLSVILLTYMSYGAWAAGGAVVPAAAVTVVLIMGMTEHFRRTNEPPAWTAVDGRPTHEPTADGDRDDGHRPPPTTEEITRFMAWEAGMTRGELEHVRKNCRALGEFGEDAVLNEIGRDFNRRTIPTNWKEMHARAAERDKKRTEYEAAERERAAESERAKAEEAEREADRRNRRRRRDERGTESGPGTNPEIAWAYGVLGLDVGAAADDCRRAFRRRAKETHPDRNGEQPDPAADFRRVNRAYSVIRTSRA